MADHFDSEHLIGHVKDAPYFETPRTLAEMLGGEGGKVFIPQVFAYTERDYFFYPQFGIQAIDQMLEPMTLRITKFMVLEVVAAVLICLILIPFANRIRDGAAPRGRMWNLLEAMLLFLRDEVARPAIGKHDADKFLPFIWTVFFFVLGCNLLGMVPWAGSPTGALATTGTLALFTFATVIGSGMAKMGPVGFWTGQVPHMDPPLAMAIILKPAIFLIEVVGLCIKHFVLAVRLLANMMAGHLVLAVLVAFVAAVGTQVYSYTHPLFLTVAGASIVGAVALSLLELFVAFLQAYI